MQLRRAMIVWISSGDNAAATRTATAGRQVCILKTHALSCQLVDVWRFDRGVPVATNIFRRHIVGDEQHEVGRAGRVCEATQRHDQEYCECAFRSWQTFSDPPTSGSLRSADVRLVLRLFLCAGQFRGRSFRSCFSRRLEERPAVEQPGLRCADRPLYRSGPSGESVLDRSDRVSFHTISLFGVTSSIMTSPRGSS